MKEQVLARPCCVGGGPSVHTDFCPGIVWWVLFGCVFGLLV